MAPSIELKLDLIEDTVKIRNLEKESLNLEGWTVKSSTGDQSFVFKNFVLPTQEVATLWSGRGSDKKCKTPLDVHWTNRYMWNNDGDGCVVLDKEGNVVASVEEKPDANGKTTTATESETPVETPVETSPSLPKGYIVAVRCTSGDFVMDSSAVSIPPCHSPEWPYGTRVRVTDPAKALPKADTIAATLQLPHFKVGHKPAANAIGKIVGSTPHPMDASKVIVGITLENGLSEFVFAIEGLAKVPSICEEFTAGRRVIVTNAEKVYPKMDTQASELTLSKWAKGRKPKVNEAGIVLGTCKHPADETHILVGFRGDNGNGSMDFVMSSQGLKLVESVSETLPIDCRVAISNPSKVYPRMDSIAAELGLPRWIAGQKPEDEFENVPNDTSEPPAKRRKLGPKMANVLATVKGSVKHPAGEGVVVGIQTEGGSEYVINESGLQAIPNEISDVKQGRRVKIFNDKGVYPKWDDMARNLGMPKWRNEAKPNPASFGTLLGSVEKVKK